MHPIYYCPRAQEICKVASEAHEFAPKNVRYRNKEDFNRTFEEEWFGEPKRYGTTKLANILYTRELQRRFESSGIDITCLTLHPGTVSTGEFSHLYVCHR